MRKQALILALASLALAGCASVYQGTDEELLVTTTPTSDAHCMLRSGDTTWSVMHTPQHVSIDKGRKDLMVSCQSYDGRRAGSVVVGSTRDGVSAVGAVVVGGAAIGFLSMANPPVAAVGLIAAGAGTGGASYALDEVGGSGVYPTNIVVPMALIRR